MIYLRLAGGLGNQLYQIAAAALLSNKLAVRVGILTESLSQYAVKREPEVLKILMPDKKFVVIDKKISSLYKVSIKHFRVGRWIPFIGTNDLNFESKMSSTATSSLQLMDGYFQTQWSLPQFESVLGIFKNHEFQQPTIASSYDVVVHVRGGDYKLSSLQLVDYRYYVAAANMAKQFGLSSFLIISDDPNYSDQVFKKVQKTVPNINYKILEGLRSTIDDFNLIRGAKVRIIGNSTFAWWATALGSRDSPTWSPKVFLPNLERRLILPNEICVDNK